MATIRDVAESAGVSTATVSRVLSDPEIVSEATRRHVLKTIERLGYAPNAAAASLRTASSRKLLVTVPDISNPFFSRIIEGIEEAAQHEGYAVLLGDTHHNADNEERYGSMLRRREADGLIFLGHRLPKCLKQRKRAGELAPIVNGCEYSPELGVPSAHINNELAARQVMDHLYGLGHRRIGIVTGPLASPLSRDRLAGVMARARHQSATSQLCNIEGDFSIPSGIAAAARLLAQRKPPTAIFCFNDEMAIGVLDYARRLGIKVPESLSVVGFDDIRFAAYTTPSLTTVRQPMHDIGRETVRLLLGILRGTIDTALSITLPHTLQIRESTAPLRRQRAPAG